MRVVQSTAILPRCTFVFCLSETRQSRSRLSFFLFAALFILVHLTIDLLLVPSLRPLLLPSPPHCPPHTPFFLLLEHPTPLSSSPCPERFNIVGNSRCCSPSVRPTCLLPQIAERECNQPSTRLLSSLLFLSRDHEIPLSFSPRSARLCLDDPTDDHGLRPDEISRERRSDRRPARDSSVMEKRTNVFIKAGTASCSSGPIFKVGRSRGGVVPGINGHTRVSLSYRLH